MYQALYRRYRPKTFDEMLGQNHITTTLKNQVEKGNIGHAYLFSGTRGTGKTSAAKIFSRAVNCLNPNHGNPCNQCENCKEILEETTMDVIEMDAASNRGIEDIRTLRDKVIYPPTKIKYKVYIVDEVHMLTKEAFNALLKTLEEPPKHLIFILATTEPEKLPQTILSRLQRFDFKRITTRDLIHNMKSITEELGIQVEDEVLSLIARNSDGAMRDALSLLDQCLSFSGERLTYEDAIDILGIANRDLIFNIVDDIKDKSTEKALLTIDEIIQDGKDIQQLIKDIINHFRNLMIIKSSKNPTEIIEVDNIERYIQQSESLDIEYILKALNILTTAETQGKWSTSPRIILEMAIIKLINEENLSLEERVKRLEKGLVEEKIVTNTKPMNKIPDNNISINKASKTQATDKSLEKQDKVQEEASSNIPTEIVDDGKELTLSIIEKEWPKVLQQIKSKKINIYALIIESELVSFSNRLLTIGYKEGFGFHKEAISSKNNKEFVEQVVSQHFNKNITINFIINDKSFIQEEPVKENKDEAIQEVVDFFGEDIVEIK
ncbi:DNA polymerase III subunit gamma/tau [Wansuia hejianensis]|uniref:DNA-directed DNA polymerase n=1 Tax=Wansuia hejianensis TaxID=2763667 RepID=A0A926IH73_9FIRM|nr:DNA polymerase III subunit gamma/tau [Wansuia hejianensis]MBC8590352.1 DNA polymerase III subunit gamma/tau [Wansuia hejianensis]